MGEGNTVRYLFEYLLSCVYNLFFFKVTWNRHEEIFISVCDIAIMAISLIQTLKTGWIYIIK
jgi:hypothetical protein